MLSDIPAQTNPRVLVDFRTSDDAGVYAWESGPALVQTVDFFTPIVDDPYTYGQIAAANSLSDIYAMGGRPLTALAIAGFPEDDVDAATIADIFRGGFDVLADAGVALLGGHTVRDREIKFGYTVTGAVNPKRMWTNAGARPGDVLILTKPLGTGVIGTAIKFGRAPSDVVERAVASMRTLNRAAAEAVATLDIHAATDITGFGFIGHASELARASGVMLEVVASHLPLIPGVLDLVAQNKSAGLHSNTAYFAPGVGGLTHVPESLSPLFFDPQTSGGLLLAVAPTDADDAMRRLADSGVTPSSSGMRSPPQRCTFSFGSFSEAAQLRHILHSRALPARHAEWYKRAFWAATFSGALRRPHPVIPDLSVLWVIALLLLCVFVLNTSIFTPILRVSEARARAVRDARELAASAGQKAAAASADFDEKLTAARAEVYGQMDDARRVALDKRTAILASTKQETARALADATTRFEGQAIEARTRLDADAETLARDIVGRILGRTA